MAYSGWVVSIGPNYASGHCLRIVLERIVVAASSMVFCIHISFSTSQISNTTFMTLNCRVLPPIPNCCGVSPTHDAN